MAPDPFPPSLWAATAPPPPDTPPLVGDAVCDVAVVGAGFAGLSAALHMAERGIRVAVLEAEQPGFGASGHNGGLVVPAFARWDPDGVRERLGVEAGDRLVRLVGGSAELVFDLIRRHGIACDAAQTGWLHPAHAESKIPWLDSLHRQWREAGHPVRRLDRPETARLTGSDRFHGALSATTGGHLNPLAFARGLAARAMALGAVVHGRTLVQSIAREGRRWRLRCTGGTVAADRVFLCTNALTGRLSPPVARSTFPLEVYQMATAPLDPARRRVILPEGHAVSDTRRNLFSYRLDAAGRLITGGMAAVQPGALDRLKTPLARRLSRMLPELGPVSFDFAWHRTAALTPDLLPRLFEIGPGLIALIGCNGRGIGMTVALGAALAGLAEGGDPDDLPISLTSPDPIRFHGLARHLPGLLLPLAKIQDCRD